MVSYNGVNEKGWMTMIKGIGVDIVELVRIKDTINKNDGFIKRILTDRELESFQQISNEKRKVEFVAGRFAAKEAYAKANGTGIGKLSFQDIEVVADNYGAPKINVDAASNFNTFVSISHSDTYAIAQVVIEEY